MTTVLYLVRDPACQWTLLLAAIVSVAILTVVRRSIGWLPAALLLYLTLNAMYVWVWTLNRYYPVTPYDQQALRFHAADAILKLLVFTAAVLIPARESLERWGVMFWTGFALVNALLVFYEWLWVDHCAAVNVCGAVVGNPSMAACLIACLTPIFLKAWRTDWPWLPLLVAAIVLTKSSIGLGLLVLVIGFWLLSELPLRRVALLSPLALLPLGIGWLTLGTQELFNNSTRFTNWKHFMHAWSTPWNMIYGTGYGTFPVMSLNIKRFLEEKLRVKQSMDWFYTMHNDWLEALFSTGIVGTVLMLAVYGLALWRLWRHDRALFQSLLLFGLFMGLNYPQHNAWTAGYGLWLVAVALRDRPPLQFPRCLSYWRQKLYLWRSA